MAIASIELNDREWREIRDAIEAFAGSKSYSVSRRIVNKAGKTALKPVLAIARANAPVLKDGDPRFIKGALRRGLRVRPYAAATTRRRGIAGAYIQPPKKARLGAAVITNSKGYYPWSMEYGWTDRQGRRHPAHPYISVARAAAFAAEGQFSRIILDLIGKEWERKLGY